MFSVAKMAWCLSSARGIKAHDEPSSDYHTNEERHGKCAMGWGQCAMGWETGQPLIQLDVLLESELL